MVGFKKKIWLPVMILSVLMTTGCGSNSGTVSSGSGDVLKVGVREAISGFGLKNEVSDTYSGMEVELGKMLADELGYSDVEYVSVTADTRGNLLNNGEVDCVATTFSITDKRKTEFDFSESYYSDFERVMVENSSMIDNLEALKGQKIGVASGSTAAKSLAKKMAEESIIPAFDEASFDMSTFNGGVTFVPMDNYPDLDVALEEGSVDAVCMDRCILQGYLNDERKLLSDTFGEQKYGVATKKGSELSESINEAVMKWKEDGTINAMIDKWDLN